MSSHPACGTGGLWKIVEGSHSHRRLGLGFHSCVVEAVSSRVDCPGLVAKRCGRLLHGRLDRRGIVPGQNPMAAEMFSVTDSADPKSNTAWS